MKTIHRASHVARQPCNERQVRDYETNVFSPRSLGDKARVVPITYKIDTARNVIRTEAFGRLRLPEIVDHFRILETDSKLPESADVFLGP